MKIWQRYILGKYISSILFIFCSITAIFIVIDLMVHIQSFAKTPSPSIWGTYYLANTLRRLDLLLPFAVLIATIRGLFNFQERGELVALLTSGISKRELLRPLFLTACVVTCLIYCNYQYTLPWAFRTVEAIEETKFGKTIASCDTPKEILLQDGTKLVFSSFNKEKKCLQNTFWIVSANKIYYMKELNIQSPLTGKWVDHIVRNSSGALEKVASFTEFQIKHLKITEEQIYESTVAPNHKSLLRLGLETASILTSSSSRAAEIKTYFLFKLIMPWLSLFAFVAAAPFCIRFSRSMPILVIYLLALASLFTLNIAINTCIILGKYQIASPFLLFGIPAIALAYIFSRRYADVNGTV